MFVLCLLALTALSGLAVADLVENADEMNEEEYPVYDQVPENDRNVMPETWPEWMFVTLTCTDQDGTVYEECKRVHNGDIPAHCVFHQQGCYERIPSKK